MPKFAAALASILLIASSIGVDIARYPQVGRTVDAGQRTGAAATAKSELAAQPSGLVETAKADSSPPREPESRPAESPRVADVAPAESARAAKPLDPKPAAGLARSQPGPVVEILDVRPMVPAAGLPAAAGTADPPAGSDELRRLPPVEQGDSAVVDAQTAGGDEPGQYAATSTP